MAIRIRGLRWKNEIIEKLESKHGLYREEVEEVVYGKCEVRKTKDNRYVVWGRTGAGRYLHVVLEREEDGWMVPLTGRDMKEREKKCFRRRNRR